MEKIQTNVIKPEISFTENDVVNLILNTQEESLLDSKIKEVEDFLANNSGKGKTESEKDDLYKNAIELWHSFVDILKGTKYNFYLNRKQYNFLTDLLLSKMEYDVNTVFFAIELTDMLGVMKKTKYVNDKDLSSFSVNATEITYIYHLISKHTVKGLTRDAYTFAEVLYKIAGISKIFNYYETSTKNSQKDIQDWILTFDDGVISDKFPVIDDVIQAKVLEPEATK